MTIPEHLANRALDSSILEPVAEPPARARVVIVGGGIIGSSIAYHLTKLGVTDVLVIERVRLTGGTTWHAAGLVSQVRGTHALTELSRINVSTYASLPNETGVDTGFRRVGSLTVARTPSRMQELLGAVDMHREFDVECRVLEPAAVREWWPLATTDDLEGAIVTPGDATVNPGDAALSLAKGAHDLGAVFAFGVTVTGFRMRGDTVVGVDTEKGVVEADTVVLAAGLWTSELARSAGTSVALYPAEHVWAMTEPLAGVDDRLPILRDLDGYFYVRHHGGSLVVGAFEPKGKPKATADVPTSGFVEFGEDWDHFAPVLAAAKQRLPVLHAAGFRHFLRAPESFTPDANLHLGEFPEVRNLFVAAGLNSQGIIYGPGVGKALAEWIVEGHPTKRSGGCTRCIGRRCSPTTDAGCVDRRCCRSCGRPAPRSVRPPVGNARRGSSRAEVANRSGATTSIARPGSARSGRRWRRPAPGWRSSTFRPMRSSSCRGLRRSPGCSTCAPPTSTSPSAGSCTRSSATNAAASRWIPR
jgi:4-methylaminobutanoate oxidase (formaldehyde-forming)